MAPTNSPTQGVKIGRPLVYPLNRYLKLYHQPELLLARETEVPGSSVGTCVWQFL